MLSFDSSLDDGIECADTCPSGCSIIALRKLRLVRDKRGDSIPKPPSNNGVPAGSRKLGHFYVEFDDPTAGEGSEGPILAKVILVTVEGKEVTYPSGATKTIPDTLAAIGWEVTHRPPTGHAHSGKLLGATNVEKHDEGYFHITVGTLRVEIQTDGQARNQDSDD